MGTNVLLFRAPSCSQSHLQPEALHPEGHFKLAYSKAISAN